MTVKRSFNVIVVNNDFNTYIFNTMLKNLLTHLLVLKRFLTTGFFSRGVLKHLLTGPSFFLTVLKDVKRC